jgi:hypothetical protein
VSKNRVWRISQELRALAPWIVFIREVGGGNLSPNPLWFEIYMEVLGPITPTVSLFRESGKRRYLQGKPITPQGRNSCILALSWQEHRIGNTLLFCIFILRPKDSPKGCRIRSVKFTIAVGWRKRTVSSAYKDNRCLIGWEEWGWSSPPSWALIKYPWSVETAFERDDLLVVVPTGDTWISSVSHLGALGWRKTPVNHSIYHAKKLSFSKTSMS